MCGVASVIGAVMAIEEVPDPGIAADQDELARGRRSCGSSSSSQNRPLTVTSMTSSGVSLQVARCTTWVTPSSAVGTDVAIGDRAAHHLDALGSAQQAIVAKRANAGVGKSRIVEQPSNEVPPDLARCAGDKDQHALLPQQLIS